MIVLARSMKLTAIAEGVETGEQLVFLRKQGCDQMQGFIFSKPVDAQAIALPLTAGLPKMVEP